MSIPIPWHYVLNLFQFLCTKKKNWDQGYQFKFYFLNNGNLFQANQGLNSSLEFSAPFTITKFKVHFLDESIAWNTYTEGSIIKPPIRASFEEVCVSIGILQSSIYIVRYAYPVRQCFGIRRLDRRPLGRVEPPELGTFVEVNLAVTRPD